jgi:putative transposase
VVLLRLSGFSLERIRVPEANDKQRLLKAIAKARSIIRLEVILGWINLSRSRYYSWLGSQKCCLNDLPSCPKTHPKQLTERERSEIQTMTCSPDYRHLSTSGLARLAARLGRAFVSPSTWCRIARAAGWRRPRQRVYPAKPKIGVRAGTPNQIWHLDTSVLRLLDGSRIYLHAIIDNFSRRILAWQVNSYFDTHVTSQLIQQAAKGIGIVPQVGVVVCPSFAVLVDHHSFSVYLRN